MKQTGALVALVTFAVGVPLSAQAQEILSLRDAVTRALQNSPVLRASGLDVRIAIADIDRAQLPFDTTFNLVLNGQNGPDVGVSTPTGVEQVSELTGTAMLQKLLPTGTTLQLGMIEDVLQTPNIYQFLSPQWTSTFHAQITQQLIRGVRPSANQATIFAAETREKATALELKWASEQLAAQVGIAYWRFVSAREEREIRRKSVELGVQVQSLTERKIAIGSLPIGSRAEANAALSRRRGQLAAASQALEDARGQVAAATFLTDPNVELESNEILPPVGAQPPAGGAQNRADVQALREHLEEQRARSLSDSDAALPLLTAGLTAEMYGVSGLIYDPACINLGQNNGVEGSANYLAACDPNGIFAGRFPQAITRTFNGQFYQLFGTLTFQIPLERRGVNGTVQRAEIQVQKSEAAVDAGEKAAEADIARLERLTQEDTRRYQAAAESVAATEQLVAQEQRKYALGANTTFDVVRVQEDLAEAKVLALRAQTDAATNRLLLALARGRLFDELQVPFELPAH